MPPFASFDHRPVKLGPVLLALLRHPLGREDLRVRRRLLCWQGGRSVFNLLIFYLLLSQMGVPSSGRWVVLLLSHSRSRANVDDCVFRLATSASGILR